MYAFIALAVAASFAAVTLILPLKLRKLSRLIPRRLHDALLNLADRTWIADATDAERQGMRMARAWFIIAAVVFATLGLSSGNMIRNDPDSIAEVAAYSALSVLLSGLLVFSAVAYCKVIPGLRTNATLRRSGIRGLWFSHHDRLPSGLTERLQEKARASRFIAIVDVTGFDIFVKSRSARDTMVRSVVTSCPEVPVSLLLLNPDTKEQDPDSRRLTVKQAVLKEMGIQHETLIARIRKTLKVVGSLNQERPPEAQIQVRYYSEKPGHRCVLFDDFLLLTPWNGQTPPDRQPSLEIERSTEGSAFYETFRRIVARMWLRGDRQEMKSNSRAIPHAMKSSVRVKLRQKPHANS